MWDAAVEVLRANDLGGWTKPAPRLYPHQWSLDSAFIARSAWPTSIPIGPYGSWRPCSRRSGRTGACPTSSSTRTPPTTSPARTSGRAHPFLVKDVLFSAIFAAANRALGQLAEWLGAPDAERAQIAGWMRRSASAVQRQWDETEQLALDLDLRTGRPLRVRAWAGLAPLLVPGLPAALALALRDRLVGPDFAGAPELAFAVVPSTAPGSPGFQPRSYWRGPSWPVANWLLWWGLRRQRLGADAAALRTANLALLARPGARFSEYFEPFTGAPLGSPDQSWTAAVALDWLADDVCSVRLDSRSSVQA